jgi:RNA-directed DNA polymerase
MQATLREVREGLRRRRHLPIPEQGSWLKLVVAGFFAYHAVPTNDRALRVFRSCVEALWLRSLRRRSQRDRMTWERLRKLAGDWLPEPRVLHPWPFQRFAVKHPRWEPYAGIPHVRICAGGAQ